MLHFGDQNITAAVKAYERSRCAAFEAFAAQAAEHVQRADFPEVIRLLDRYYGHVDYSLTSLFTDEQRRIVQLILNSTLWDIENSLTTIYEDHASLLHYLSQAGLPKPPALPWPRASPSMRDCGARWRAIPIDQAQMRSFLSLAKADQVPLETANALLHRRPAHEARHGRAANVLGIAGDAGPRAGAGAHPDGAALRAESVAGAEHLVRDSAHLQLRADRAGTRRPPRWEKNFNELGACLRFDTEAIRALPTEAASWVHRSGDLGAASDSEHRPSPAFSPSSLSANRSPRQTMVLPAKPATHRPMATRSRSGSSHRLGSTWWSPSTSAPTVMARARRRKKLSPSSHRLNGLRPLASTLSSAQARPE